VSGFRTPQFKECRGIPGCWWTCLLLLGYCRLPTLLLLFRCERGRCCPLLRGVGRHCPRAPGAAPWAGSWQMLHSCPLVSVVLCLWRRRGPFRWGGVWAGSRQEHRGLAEMPMVSPAAPPCPCVVQHGDAASASSALNPRWQNTILRLRSPSGQGL